MLTKCRRSFDCENHTSPLHWKELTSIVHANFTINTITVDIVVTSYSGGGNASTSSIPVRRQLRPRVFSFSFPATAAL